MEANVLEQCVHFFHACGVGAVIGLLYIVFGFFRRRFLPMLWDAFFIIAAAAVGIVFFMTACGGYVQIYHICGLIVGICSVRGILLLTRGKVKHE